MKWWIIVVLACLLGALIVPATVSAKAEVSKFKGDSVFAILPVSDPNNTCLQGYALVVASEGWFKDAPGKPEVESVGSVFILQENSCSGEVVVDAFGSSALSDAAFQVDAKLNSATLNATVEACDFLLGTCFPITINMAWNGVGDLLRDKFAFRGNFAGCKFATSSKSTSRTAVASGSLTAFGHNFTPTPSDFAQIATVRDGMFEINCS